MLILSPEQVSQYEEEGWAILPNVLSPAQLSMLRKATQTAIAKEDAVFAEKGDVVGIGARGKRYFVTGLAREVRELRDFLHSAPLADVARQLLGEEVYLFWEQFVVKGPDPQSSFAWHQDSGYVQSNHQRYLTLWLALDDVSEANGCVYVLPYSKSGTRSRVEHIPMQGTNDLVGYFGADEGVPAVVKAGSLVAFSSHTFHRSGSNKTDQPRRAYIAQYSREIICKADGVTPWGEFERVE